MNTEYAFLILICFYLLFKLVQYWFFSRNVLYVDKKQYRIYRVDTYGAGKVDYLEIKKNPLCWKRIASFLDDTRISPIKKEVDEDILIFANKFNLKIVRHGLIGNQNTFGISWYTSAGGPSADF